MSDTKTTKCDECQGHGFDDDMPDGKCPVCGGDGRMEVESPVQASHHIGEVTEMIPAREGVEDVAKVVEELTQYLNGATKGAEAFNQKQYTTVNGDADTNDGRRIADFFGPDRFTNSALFVCIQSKLPTLLSTITRLTAERDALSMETKRLRCEVSSLAKKNRRLKDQLASSTNQQGEA